MNLFFLKCFSLFFEYQLICHVSLKMSWFLYLKEISTFFKVIKICIGYFLFFIHYLMYLHFIFCLLSPLKQSCLVTSANLYIVPSTVPYHLPWKTVPNCLKTRWSDFLLCFQSTSHLFKSQHFSQVQNFFIGQSPLFLYNLIEDL